MAVFKMYFWFYIDWFFLSRVRCNLCDKSFVRLFNLNRHTKTCYSNHNQNIPQITKATKTSKTSSQAITVTTRRAVSEAGLGSSPQEDTVPSPKPVMEAVAVYEEEEKEFVFHCHECSFKTKYKRNLVRHGKCLYIKEGLYQMCCLIGKGGAGGGHS